MMRTMKLGTSNLQVPVIAVGCMRILGWPSPKPSALCRPAWRRAQTFLTMRTYMATGPADRSSPKRCT